MNRFCEIVLIQRLKVLTHLEEGDVNHVNYLSVNLVYAQQAWHENDLKFAQQMSFGAVSVAPEKNKGLVEI